MTRQWLVLELGGSAGGIVNLRVLVISLVFPDGNQEGRLDDFLNGGQFLVRGFNNSCCRSQVFRGVRVMYS